MLLSYCSGATGTGEQILSFSPVSVDYPQVLLRVKLLASEAVSIGPENFRIWEDDLPVSVFLVTPSTARQSLVLLLDRSSSLENVIGDVKKAATEFLTSLPAEVKVAVISFASDIDINQDFTREKSLLKKAIGSIRSWGGTILYDASFMASEQLWASSDPLDLRTLVLFTDGRDETPVGHQAMSTHTLEDVLKLAVKKNIRILSVGLGGQIDEKVLKEMAQTTGGFYLYAPSPRELFGVYRTISRRLKMERHLNISFMAHDPTRDRRPHVIRMESTLGGKTDNASAVFDAPLDPRKTLVRVPQRISLDISQPALKGMVIASAPQLVEPPGKIAIRDHSLRKWTDSIHLLAAASDSAPLPVTASGTKK